MDIFVFTAFILVAFGFMLLLHSFIKEHSETISGTIMFSNAGIAERLKEIQREIQKNNSTIVGEEKTEEKK